MIFITVSTARTFALGFLLFFLTRLIPPKSKALFPSLLTPLLVGIDSARARETEGSSSQLTFRDAKGDSNSGGGGREVLDAVLGVLADNINALH